MFQFAMHILVNIAQQHQWTFSFYNFIARPCLNFSAIRDRTVTYKLVEQSLFYAKPCN